MSNNTSNLTEEDQNSHESNAQLYFQHLNHIMNLQYATNIQHFQNLQQLVITQNATHLQNFQQLVTTQNAALQNIAINL